jgi:Flp pilus assembly protein CpaB
MKASTLLGLALSVIVGLIVVAGIRFSGVLNRTPAVQAKVEPVMVLAAARNLFQGTAATTNDVGLRAANSAELDFVRRNPEKVLPANPEAAHLRILKCNISANELLLKEHFEDMTLPTAIGARIAPGMRAVDVELPKERAGAGLLRLGEHVDVYLTSTICTDASGSQPRSAIAAIANGLKIVVKRDVLYTLMIPVPEDKPVSYILEANPYRAALIEFSKSKGLLTLVASSAQAKEPENTIGLQKEQELVDRFIKREASVSENDLAKIFRLPPLPAPLQPMRVETYDGSRLSNVTIVHTQAPPGVAGEGSYCFFMPGETPQVAAKQNGAKKDSPQNSISTVQAPPKNKK